MSACGGGSSDPPRSLEPLRFGAEATRWASVAGIFNQVPGSSPRGAIRGSAAGGTSSWEVEPSIYMAALTSVLSLVGIRPGGGGQLGQGTRSIQEAGWTRTLTATSSPPVSQTFGLGRAGPKGLLCEEKKLFVIVFTVVFVCDFTL